MEHGDHVGVGVNHVEHEGKTERTPNIVGDDPGVDSVEHDLVQVVHRVPFVVVVRCVMYVLYRLSPKASRVQSIFFQRNPTFVIRNDIAGTIRHDRSQDIASVLRVHDLAHVFFLAKATIGVDRSDEEVLHCVHLFSPV